MPSPPESLAFDHRSRIHILAPHPDDESLGAGGLIQQALAAGAAVRVTFITDGDNNPWPQRWIEARWRIGHDDRRRWGLRRRAEALRALGVLGLGEHDTRFLGFRDSRILNQWRERNPALITAIGCTLADWPADILIVPSPRDRHGDHRATFHLVRQALATLTPAPAVFSYLIHPGWLAPQPVGCLLHLDPAQQRTKLQAILCHETQTTLSRGRFSSFARPEELFTPEHFETTPEP